MAGLAGGLPRKTSTLSWNCRRLGNPRAVQFLTDMIVQKQPKMVFLCETLCKKDRVDRFRNQIGFEGSFVVDSKGRNRCLALIWRNEEEVKLLSYSKNHIDVVGSIADKEDWRLTGFYGESNQSLRRNTRELLRLLFQQSSLKWCVFDDLNNIISQEEKRRGRSYPEWLVRDFCETIMDCNLVDMDMVGYPFTWEKSRDTQEWVELRLDRALVNSQWMDMYKKATLSNIEISTSSTSDHMPIFLEVSQSTRVVADRKFRFENAWLRDQMCKDISRKAGL